MPVRNRNYFLPLQAVPIGEARDFAKENGVSLIETSTLNSTKLELSYKQSFQGYSIVFLRNK